MIQELLARAAEDLTVALNNFETARKELTDDELATFKEVCRKAKEAVQEALEAAKGDLDAKTAETIRQIETLIQQGLTSIDEKVAQAGTDITGKVDKAKQDVDAKVQQGLTSIDEKVAQAGTDITGKVDKAKQDVDTKVQQGMTSIDEKVAQGVAAVGTKEQEAKNTLNEKESQILQGIKTVLEKKLSHLEKIKETIAAELEKKSKAYTDSLLIKIFQNGYIQWPGMPSPQEDTNLHFEGYSWYEVNYDGNFFRAKGRNAKAFSSQRLTKEQIKDGAYIFQDDEQGDAIRNISGVFGCDARYQPNIFSEESVSETGCFEATREHTKSGAPSLSTAAGNGNIAGWTNIKFRASRVVPTAEENRSRNLTFTIWALVKDE